MTGGNSKRRRRERRTNALIYVAPLPTQESEATRIHKSKSMPVRTSQRNTSTRPIKEWLSGLGTLLGIVTAFFSFFPHLTTSDLVPMDPRYVLSYKIDVTNGGILPIFSVRSLLSPKEITNKVGGGYFGSGGRLMDLDNCCVSMLSPGDSYTFSPERLMRLSAEDLGDAEYTLVISYIPILPPVRMNKCVRYKSHLDSAGSLHWFRAPASCRLFGSHPLTK